jgi:hypothetical protein
MESFATPLLWLSNNCQRAFLRFDARHPLPMSNQFIYWKYLLDQTVNCQQWILDLRRLPPLPQLVQQILAEQWLQRIQQPCVRKVAVLLPQDVYNMLVLEWLLPTALPREWPEIQFFADFASSWCWLNPPARIRPLTSRTRLKQRVIYRLYPFRSSRIRYR